MEKIEHKIIEVNGLKMHVAEIGQGPLVLFLHGFPELWYSWRHQLLYMAAHGYRAVAPDLRGYGDTIGVGEPIDDAHTNFTILHMVGDIVALLDAIAPDQDKVFVVGHNWGAIIAWHFCLFRPDRIKALVNLSVAFLPRNPNDTIVGKLRQQYGDDHYICRFQEKGDIEAEFDKIGTRKVLEKFLSHRETSPPMFPKDKQLEDEEDGPVNFPTWLSKEDIDYYTTKFQQTGFTGGLNYYRAFDLSWELSAAWTGAQVKVPAKLIVGELDHPYHIPGMKEYIHDGGFKKDVPLLQQVVVVNGAAHYLNQEMPDQINLHIYDFFGNFSSSSSSSSSSS